MSIGLEYIAGFFDGEGCIFASKDRGLQIIFTNTNFQVLNFIRNYFGYSTRVIVKNRGPKNKFKATKTCYYIRYFGSNAEDILKKIKPFLIIKREECSLALEYQATFSVPKTRNVISQDTKQKRKLLSEDIKAHKRNIPILLNVGCGPDLLKGYVNIDIDNRGQIESRYNIVLDKNIEIEQYDIFNFPFLDGEVTEVLCRGFLEHLSFEEEGKFLNEVKRVLKKHGLFHFTVPDFDNLMRQWLEAEDNFIDFYKVGENENWFGQGNRNMNNKWGYLTAFIYGNQNGEGQFHRNAYTKKKIESIMKKLNFSCEISTFMFKETDALMLECIATKL